MVPEVHIVPAERIGYAPDQIKKEALPWRYRQETFGRRVSKTIGKAAVWGFGLSLGRDVYIITKRLFGFLISILLPFVWLWLPGVAGYLLMRRRKVVDVVLGVIFLGAGFGFCVVVAFVYFSLSDSVRTEGVIKESMLAAAIMTGISAAIGGLLGRSAREKDVAVTTVAEHNAAFLERLGIAETGGKDITHYDGNGRALRYIETHKDRLVFMVVGHRGRRASILMDEHGRMVEYQGGA